MSDPLEEACFQLSILFGEDLTNDGTFSQLDRLAKSTQNILQTLEGLEDQVHQQHALYLEGKQ